MLKKSSKTSVKNNTTLWSLYVIRCANDSLYCGISTDVQRRFAEHKNMGRKTAKYLRGKGPLQLVFQCESGDRSTASKMEAYFKSLHKQNKEQIIQSQSIDLLNSTLAKL